MYKNKQSIANLSRAPLQHTCQSTLYNWLTAIIPNSTMRCYQSTGEPLKKKMEEKGRRGNQRNISIKLQVTKNTTGKLIKSSG